MNNVKLNITINADERELLICVLTKYNEGLLEAVVDKAKFSYNFERFTESEILKDMYDSSRALLSFASYKFEEVVEEEDED